MSQTPVASVDVASPGVPTAEAAQSGVRRRALELAGYAVYVSAVTAGVWLGATRLPPVLLAGATGAVLTVTAIVLLRRRLQSPRRQRIASLRRELDQTRRSYRQLFSSVPCFICVLDREHRIVEANDLYRDAFGPSQLSRCYVVCKHRTTKCPNCLVEKTFEDGQVRSSEEVLTTGDGRRIEAVVYTQPVYDDDGEIATVMEVFTDITEVKRLQRQLALTGRAVASMAHRVKNILMGLEGGIFVVNTGLESDDRASINEGWDMVQRNVGLVSRIVRDLLFCSKDREPARRPGVDVRAIVNSVHELFARRVAGDRITLQVELDQGELTGTFDPDGLHSLLCNLVANAIDACRFDPSTDTKRHVIALRSRRIRDDALVLEVEDNGAGIPEELNGKVFQDFFSSKGTEGTGIGLLVVQKVAEEHGGRVTFSSVPGIGTTFTVTLPRSLGQLSPTTPVTATV